jgi:protein CpxP
MKRSLIPFVVVLVGIFIVSSSSLVAQGMRVTPQERADSLKVRLSLTDKQTEQVVKIYEQQQLDFEKARNASSGDREAMRAAMTKIMQKTDAKIEELLDEKQMKKYEAFKKERMERMQQRRPG